MLTFLCGLCSASFRNTIGVVADKEKRKICKSTNEFQLDISKKQSEAIADKK
jgi:hypothetical protein